MKSRYTDQIDPTCPCSDYPRPQLQRSAWLCLNGPWKAVLKSRRGTEQMTLLVPFSMESKINGNHSPLQPDEQLILSRDLPIPKEWMGQRILLHLDAVDQQTEVFVNGQLVANSRCGYLPICAEITHLLKSVNTLQVVVQDPTDCGSGLRGKQKLHPSGIWYTAQSGIWQTVWLEPVPQEYIEKIRIRPLLDQSAVELLVICEHSHPISIQLENREFSGFSNTPLVIPLQNPHPWTCEDPFLYPFEIKMKKDRVTSYFGLRCFSVEQDAQGTARLCLNHQPLFQAGCLDQGYISDGMLSWPCDQAMIDDLTLIKKMGFNMIRKHVKIEPLRWYYHCDRLGLLVWQDMVNGGGRYSLMTISSPLITGVSWKDHRYRWFARKDPVARKAFLEEMEQMVDHLINCVSIAVWVLFNEGWGQFDARLAFERIQQRDPTRILDHASGWHDQQIGNLKSQHVYFKPYRYKPDPLGRAVVLSEFGGYNLKIKGHTKKKRNFGYHRMNNSTELEEALTHLYEQELLPAVKQGLAACVYTQFSDVESELNGLVTYDRMKIKVNPERLKRLNQRLIDAGSQKQNFHKSTDEKE